VVDTHDDATTGRLDPARPSVDEDGLTIGGVTRLATETLDVGATLGRYRILEPLGQGAMGIVYAAYDPRLDRRVALKVLHVPDEPGATSSEGPQRLVREAQALAKLAHPNVVAVYDAGVVGGRVFVAMELVAGVTLREWLGQIDRDWREVVEHVLLAGRGLAAAHEAGLVHRDFKPENVIVGDDGRVRVLDFGLARTSGDRAPIVQLDTADDAVDDEQLTRTGALVGTPAYMAPEQFTAGTIDARTDQFAFCVTAWELVYGQRPFRGSGAAALGYQITRVTPSPPPADAKAPAWLLPLLQRGLAKAPDERHASLGALLDEIEHGLRPARTSRWPLLAVGIVAIGAVAGTIALVGNRETPCEHSAARIAEVWGAPQQTAIRSAFAATQSPIADDTRERVSATIDAWAAKWTASHTAACEATHVRHEQSEAALDLRMRCLERLRSQLGSFVTMLGEADAALVQQAVAATEKLGDVARCDDLEQLGRMTPMPEDARLAERIGTLDAELGSARGLAQGGRFADARDRAIAIADEAATIGYRPLEAEAAYVAAMTHSVLKETEGAEAAAVRSVTAAIAGGDAYGTASSLLVLCRLHASTGRADESRRCIAIAGGAVERAGSPAALTATLREAQGLIEFERGEHEAGLALLREAITLSEAGGDSLALANVVFNYGDASRVARAFAEAESALLRSIGIRERLQGPSHPDVAHALNSLAVVYIEQARTDDAVRELGRVLAIRKAAFGPQHDHVGATLNNLGIALRKGDRCAEAAPIFEQGIAIRVAGLGETNFKVAAMRGSLAGCKLALGDLEAAMTLASKAIEGLGDPSLAEDRCDAIATLAEVHARKGDAAAAAATRALCEHAG
jgi:tetratricopeptide (TPR) repeat protein/tRNA A-37 threonylcarbamoyl transferase component Bud32